MMETQSHINQSIDNNHIIGSGNPPTIVLGPGAGAGSVSVVGNDNAFTITLIAGAGTTNNSIVFTAIFAQAFTIIPHTVFSAGNANTAASTNRMWLNNNALTSFEFRITNPALVARQTYIWKFITIQ